MTNRELEEYNKNRKIWQGILFLHLIRFYIFMKN